LLESESDNIELINLLNDFILYLMILADENKKQFIINKFQKNLSEIKDAEKLETNKSDPENILDLLS
jgi:hypothetical protein